MRQQPVMARSVKPGKRGVPVRRAMATPKCSAKHRDILGPGAERRDRDDVEAQPVQQVGPEPAHARQRRKIGVGGADQPHVGCQGLVAADPFELAILDYAQHLLLHGRSGVGDLVQEQGAVVGPLEAADMPPQRARESARPRGRKARVSSRLFGESAAQLSLMKERSQRRDR